MFCVFFTNLKGFSGAVSAADCGHANTDCARAPLHRLQTIAVN